MSIERSNISSGKLKPGRTLGLPRKQGGYVAN